MTMLLAHPTDEDLGRFVEGRLDEKERADVVNHIADCDECRVMVVDATAFAEESAAATRGSGGRSWLALAASIAIVVGGVFTWHTLRDPLIPVIEATAHLSSRPVEGRLSGFAYLKRNSMRGAEQDETDLDELKLQDKVAKVLERRGDDPRMLHAKGVSLLVSAAAKGNERDQIVAQRKEALALLESAVRQAPNDPNYLSDLAAALIASGDPASLQRAVDVSNRALQINPRSAEALFNRAKALALLDSPEAVNAYKRYLTVDPSSPWADEVRTNIETLQPLP